MKKITKFQTESEWIDKHMSLSFPNVSKYESTVVFEDVHPATKMNYLTLVALEDDFTVTSNSTEPIQYSIDNGVTWSTLNLSETTPSLSNGKTIKLKANGYTASDYGYGPIITNKTFNAKGNVLSMLFDSEFESKTLPDTTYTLGRLFNGTKVIDASALMMPSVLTDSCYYEMFRNCELLASIPELPATTLTSSCYNSMFQGCISLTSIPENLLPATTILTGCYAYMFRDCSSLTSIPEKLLPATTLGVYCYQYMFGGCTSLTNLPELPANELAERCYSNMFNGCTSLTSISEDFLPATTLAQECYNSMFYGCGFITIPINLLPATTLAPWCYCNMFAYCKSLTNVANLPATTMARYCYDGMYQQCNLSTIPADLLPATVLEESCYTRMFQGCTSLESIPEGLLPATTLADWCYDSMFNNCTTLVSVPENLLPATTLSKCCYQGMFQQCPFEVAPTLPASSLAYSCYAYMFYGCKNINTIRMYATSPNPSSRLWTTDMYYWLFFASSTGTIYIKTCTSTSSSYGGCLQLDTVSCIPSGWTAVRV